LLDMGLVLAILDAYLKR